MLKVCPPICQRSYTGKNVNLLRSSPRRKFLSIIIIYITCIRWRKDEIFRAAENFHYISLTTWIYENEQVGNV